MDIKVPDVKIDMNNHVKEMIDKFPVELTGRATYPASKKIFDASHWKKPCTLKVEAFHSMVAKALFLTMRAGPDMRLAVAFLCARVKEPTTKRVWINKRALL